MIVFRKQNLENCVQNSPQVSVQNRLKHVGAVHRFYEVVLVYEEARNYQENVRDSTHVKADEKSSGALRLNSFCR